MNEIYVKALKEIQNKVGKIYWIERVSFEHIEACLVSIRNNSLNSGWYNPKAVKIPGLVGFYMLNEDGSLFCESRIVKKDEKYFAIEEMTAEGWNEFEILVRELQS